MRDPDYSAEMPGRLAKLETAISKQRTVKFGYRAMTSGKETERTLNPYGCSTTAGSGTCRPDLDRDAIRRSASRASAATSASRRGASATSVPAEFDIDAYRGRASWQFGEPVGEARIEVARRPAGGSSAPSRQRRVEDGVFVTEYASLPMLASWVLRQDGRAIPLEPDDLAARSRTACGACARHEGEPPKPARESPRASRRSTGERPRPVTPERFGLLQALLAYLLAACGEDKEAVIPAAELVERFQIPPRSSRITCRCSTSSTSAAAATRSTPSCTATRCTSTRSSGATRSAPRRG
jgi:proteasome accessory factor C